MTLQTGMAKSSSRALLCMPGRPEAKLSEAHGDKLPAEGGGLFRSSSSGGLGRGDGTHKGVLHRGEAGPGITAATAQLPLPSHAASKTADARAATASAVTSAVQGLGQMTCTVFVRRWAEASCGRCCWPRTPLLAS